MANANKTAIPYSCTNRFFGLCLHLDFHKVLILLYLFRTSLESTKYMEHQNVFPVSVK